MLLCHLFSFMAGFVLDLFLGDPCFLPHPVRLIGKLITLLEKSLRKDGQDTQSDQIRKGALLVLTVLAVVGLLSFLVLSACYRLNLMIGVAVESIMTYQILALKCLKTESGKVYGRLRAGDVPGARRAVSMIVGRDTDSLDEAGIIRAAVETVAENCSDGVIAPMLCTALGGPVLGFLYKAVNTMDSMLGYQNDRYLYFGRAAAKLDDAVNFIPARISALLMILSAFLCGKEADGKKALAIYKRDRKKHASPNSAQTEAVCAGALGIRLAGDAVYGGKTVTKPYIGDDTRAVRDSDILLAGRLLYQTSFLCEGFCAAALWLTVRLL